MRERAAIVTWSVRTAQALAAAMLVVMLGGCIYDAPLTTSPTRRVDTRLLGDWTSDDGKETLKVRAVDATTYVLLLNGDLFRAYHSDFADTMFVTVQDLDGPARKYAYLRYVLSDDGKRLTAFAVNSDLIPATLKTSSEARRLLRANIDNPKLFVDEPLELGRRN